MPASTDTTASKAALLAAYRDAAQWLRAQATRSPDVAAALAARGLTAQHGRAAGIGWAPNDPAALTDHLIRRGHRLAVLRDAGLSVRRGPRHGDVLRGRVTFAYRDPGGAAVGFTARTTTDAAAKWINTPSNAVFDKSRLLYGGHALQADTRAVAVVEGAWDAAVVTAATSGQVLGVAACGTRFSPHHAAAVADLGMPVIVATDADPAGRAAAVRIHDTLTGAGITHAAYLALPDGHDPASWHADGHDLPAALAAARPGSLTGHVIDTHRDQLDPANGVAAQLAALRALAPSLAALPAEDRAAAIAHLRDLTGLLTLTIHDTLTTITSNDPAAAPAGPPPPLSTLPSGGPHR